MSEIEQFERSTGWVTLGKDPIRSSLRGNYHGPERRSNLLYELEGGKRK